MQQTTNYKFNQPELSDYADIQPVSENFEIADTELKKAEDHREDGDIHVTAEKKAEWDAKAPGEVAGDLAAHTGNSTIHVTAGDKKKWNAAPIITQVSATLSASGWSGSPLKQTINVPGATVSGAGLVQPVPSSDQGLTYWNDAGVIALQLTKDGQMTFQADSAPAGDIPLAIIITALGVTG